MNEDQIQFFIIELWDYCCWIAREEIQKCSEKEMAYCTNKSITWTKSYYNQTGVLLPEMPNAVVDKMLAALNKTFPPIISAGFSMTSNHFFSSTHIDGKNESRIYIQCPKFLYALVENHIDYFFFFNALIWFGLSKPESYPEVVQWESYKDEHYALSPRLSRQEADQLIEKTKEFLDLAHYLKKSRVEGMFRLVIPTQIWSSVLNTTANTINEKFPLANTSTDRNKWLIKNNKLVCTTVSTYCNPGDENENSNYKTLQNFLDTFPCLQPFIIARAIRGPAIWIIRKVTLQFFLELLSKTPSPLPAVSKLSHFAPKAVAQPDRPAQDNSLSA